MPTDIDTTLLPDEKDDLARYEATIRQGQDAFYEVSNAFRAIKMDKLYRGKFQTFEEYCTDRWGVVRKPKK